MSSVLNGAREYNYGQKVKSRSQLYYWRGWAIGFTDPNPIKVKQSRSVRKKNDSSFF